MNAMVIWKYCNKCGTVVDEFESVCSACQSDGQWEKESEYNLYYNHVDDILCFMEDDDPRLQCEETPWKRYEP